MASLVRKAQCYNNSARTFHPNNIVVLVSRNMIGSGEDNKFQYTALQSDCTLIPRTLRAAVAGAGSLRA